MPRTTCIICSIPLEGRIGVTCSDECQDIYEENILAEADLDFDRGRYDIGIGGYAVFQPANGTLA
jgi:hypothetical protein